MSIKRITKDGKSVFQVQSRTGRNLGTFGTRAAAENRLGEVEFFKARSKKKKRLKSRRTGSIERP